MLNHQN